MPYRDEVRAGRAKLPRVGTGRGANCRWPSRGGWIADLHRGGGREQTGGRLARHGASEANGQVEVDFASPSFLLRGVPSHQVGLLRASLVYPASSPLSPPSPMPPRPASHRPAPTVTPSRTDRARLATREKVYGGLPRRQAGRQTVAASAGATCISHATARLNGDLCPGPGDPWRRGEDATVLPPLQVPGSAR